MEEDTKKCIKDYNKAYYEANKEKLLARHNTWNNANKERVKKNEKAWREANKDKIKIVRALYLERNKAKIRIKRKIYYEANKKRILAKAKAWVASNKKKAAIYYSAWHKQKRRIDIKFRLGRNMSKAVSESLRENRNGRSWETIIGYTLNDLRKHLEKQFVNGMTWENYGEWHIEHKIPISVHNFTKVGHQDFKKCWALSNLQPMWAKENLSKGTKIDKHFQPSLLI